MRERLSRRFYLKPTLEVAQNLLGKYIIRKIGKKEISGKIIETEAYIGPKDKASHAYNWKITSRNWVEYLEGGYIYIYLVYGMYWQLNIVTQKAGKPECVLIRGLDEVKGPGKVCQFLKLDKKFNRKQKNLVGGLGRKNRKDQYISQQKNWYRLRRSLLEPQKMAFCFEINLEI